ncbi:CaiF/GrlA family transcriptional regulator, partial [Escherichia coli]
MFLCRFIYQIKRTWKMGSKNKNGDYVIPDSVKNYDGEPLYIL